MRDRIPFSHLLPLIDLVLLVILVFVPVTLTAFRLYQAANGSDHIHLRSGEFDVDLPRDQIIPWAIRVATVPRARTMMAINLPGSIIQWLISLPSRTSPPSGWHPQVLALETWQALVFPFFALPFWWLVGCGLDVPAYKEHLHWSLLATGTVLFVLLFAVIISFCFSGDDRAELALPMRGFVGWAIGFAILPTAWVVQQTHKPPSPEEPRS
jgi:hypothetical protein